MRKRMECGAWCCGSGKSDFGFDWSVLRAHLVELKYTRKWNLENATKTSSSSSERVYPRINIQTSRHCSGWDEWFSKMFSSLWRVYCRHTRGCNQKMYMYINYCGFWKGFVNWIWVKFSNFATIFRWGRRTRTEANASGKRQNVEK